MKKGLEIREGKLFRGNKELNASNHVSIHKVVRQVKLKNGKEYQILNALSPLKLKVGIDKCPTFNPSPFVRKAVEKIQRHLEHNTSYIIRDTVSEVYSRLNGVCHERYFEQICCGSFESLGFVLIKSDLTNPLMLILAADKRLRFIAAFVHRFTIYYVAFPKATTQDCLFWTTGSREAKLLMESGPRDVIEAVCPAKFMRFVFTYIASGFESLFFSQAVKLCRERKIKMLQIVGTHEALIEALFEKLAETNTEGKKQECIRHLKDQVIKMTQGTSYQC
jgi:hypothetical protein